MKWLRQLFFRRRRYNDLSVSIHEHLEEKIDELMDDGMSIEEATRTARREFGNVTSIEERSREVWQWPKLEGFWADLKLSFYQFRKAPAFTVTALAALALGIGATSAIFSVIDTVLIKPLNYPDSERIVLFMLATPGGQFPIASIPEFHLWKDEANLFKDVSASDSSVGLNLMGDRPELVHGIRVTSNYFRLFGARAILGHTFTDVEEHPNGGRTTVLSYDLWNRNFDADPHIVGKTISLGSEPYTVIGVVNRHFETYPNADLWLPLQIDPNSTDHTPYFRVVGRLKPGVKLDQVDAGFKVAADVFRQKYPDAIPPQLYFAVQPLRDAVVSNARSSLLLLLGAVGFVLLIACANVANLLLIRASSRKREFAIRASLGASRSRIFRQLLTESVLLSLIGGFLGLALGELGVHLLLTISSGDIPRIGINGSAVALDWRVLAFTSTLCIVTGIAFGLVPAISASGPNVSTALNESNRAAGTGVSQGRTRSLLVVSEVSLAVVLLVCTALFIRTFIALRSVDPGFSPHKILTMQMALTGAHFEKTASVAQLVRDARERIDAIPGVVASASAVSLPLDGGGHMLSFNALGRPTGKGPDAGSTEWTAVSPGYFDVLQIPIIRGRAFSEGDTETAPPVVIINQTMAKIFWPNENPIGQRIVTGKGMGPVFADQPRLIIGVVGDIRADGLNSIPQPLMFTPQAQVPDKMNVLLNSTESLHWLLRTNSEPHQAVSAVEDQLRQTSGGLPVARVRTMDEILAQSTARQNFNMQLLSMFGMSALVLAAIGIYGLMAYSVQQRVQEIGVRMALGADRSRIRNMVVWQGMRLVIIGVLIGTGAALALTRLIASFLFGVRSWDPTIFVIVQVLLSFVALLAVWMPAQRGARLDPMQALRME